MTVWHDGLDRQFVMRVWDIFGTTVKDNNLGQRFGTMIRDHGLGRQVETMGWTDDLGQRFVIR